MHFIRFIIKYPVYKNLPLPLNLTNSTSYNAIDSDLVWLKRESWSGKKLDHSPKYDTHHVSSALKLWLQNANMYITNRKNKIFANTSTQYILRKKERNIRLIYEKNMFVMDVQNLTFSSVCERPAVFPVVRLKCIFWLLECNLRNTHLCPNRRRALDTFCTPCCSFSFLYSKHVCSRSPTDCSCNIRKLWIPFLCGVVRGTNCKQSLPVKL